MSTERWRRLDELFTAAVPQDDEARGELVTSMAARDDALRAEALSLLAAADASTGFLEKPALETLARSMAADGWSLAPGERVGVYRVDCLLGSGGTGEVWRARDERLDRDVAIKVLLPHFARDADRLRRFEQEARTAGALNHSNILAVYDVGQHRGAPFLVSECLEGQSLRKRLDSGPLPIDQALNAGAQIARGLAAAHARGIIHRDLKPDNVFLRSDGAVKILDFGLAKLQPGLAPPGTDPHTISGVIAGTVGYMSPEQVRGDDIDARSDLFACGAVLYEAVSGVRPFRRASSVDTLHAILNDPPADLGTLTRDLPADCLALIERCLQKSPAARFQTATELASAIEAAARTLEASSGPAAKSVSLADRMATGPFSIDEALCAARQIAFALEPTHDCGIAHGDLRPPNIICNADGTVVLRDGSRSPSGDTLRAGDALYVSPEQARGDRADRRADTWAFGCLLFHLLCGRAPFRAARNGVPLPEILARAVDWSALPPHTPPRVLALLRRCLEQDPRRRIRDIADVRLELEDSGQADVKPSLLPAIRFTRRQTVAVAAGIVALVAIGTAAAFRNFERSRPSAPNDLPMRFSVVTNFAGVEWQPALSPDGRSVAFVSNHGNQWDIYVRLISGGNPIQVTNDPNLEIGPRWSQDGTRLIYARLEESARIDVWIVPALGGVPRRVLANALSPSWSRDGRMLAYRSQLDDTIWMADANGADARQLTRRDPTDLRHNQPAISPDGRSVIFVRQLSSQTSELAIVDVNTTAVRNLTSDNALALSPRWAPDGKGVYFVSSRGGTLSVWKRTLDSGAVVPITAGQDDNEEIDLSLDGSRLVFSSARARVGLAEIRIDAASRGRTTWLTADAARGETAPQYSLDGRRIVYFSNRNGLERETLWAMDSDGGNVTRLIDDGRLNIHPRWTADGQELLYISRAANDTSRAGRNQLCRMPAAGGAAQILPIAPWDTTWGDVAPEGQLIYRKSATTGEIVDLRSNQRTAIPDLRGAPWWSPDGRLYAFAVSPSQKPADAGVWVSRAADPPRLVFAGWVVWLAFDGPQHVLALEGGVDLKGRLWRVDIESGRRTIVGEVPLLLRHGELTTVRFDVHPDGRRIVAEARPVFESDIGLVENVK